MAITPRDPFIRPTLRELAAHIEAPCSVVPGKAICVREGAGEPPLFLVHDGLDSLQYVYTLTPHLSAAVPVYGLPAAPLDAPGEHTIETMAARLIGMIREVQSTGPYRLAGWSTGGVVAYEIAHQLLCDRDAVEFLGLFDAMYAAGFREPGVDSPEQASAAFEDKAELLRSIQPRSAFAKLDEPFLRALAELRADLAAMEFDTLAQRCRKQSLLPMELAPLSDLELRQTLRRRYSNMRAQARYRASRLPIPLHLFVARDSRGGAPLLGWPAVIPAAQIHTRSIPGDHYSMMAHPNIMTLAEELLNDLAAARSGGLSHALPQ